MHHRYTFTFLLFQSFFIKLLVWMHFCLKSRGRTPLKTNCNKEEETIVHLFCECEKVTPLWNELLTLIHLKVDSNFNLTNFEKIFLVPGTSDKFLSYLFLLLKYSIYTCKCKSSLPTELAFRSFVKTHKETEYFLAKKEKLTKKKSKKKKMEIRCLNFFLCGM